MKTFEVTGQALGVVEVSYEVKAENKEDAMSKAESLFKTGEMGVVKYLDDDMATIDFEPSTVDEIAPK